MATPAAPPDSFRQPSADGLAFATALEVVGRVSSEIAAHIRQELVDQRTNLKLIASENFASPAVLLAMGNWMSDKYAEGVPGHRFYAGCDNVDAIERHAAERAKRLFGADHAYVQPHSGIDANLVAFWSVLTHRVEGPALRRLGAKDVRELAEADWEALRREMGNQKLMGMALDAGGHLTHGFRPNVSGKLFRHCSYTVDPETHRIDYDHVRRCAREERPLLLLAAYSSYPRKVDFRIFREIADEVGATLMVDMAHFAGLVAGKVLAGDFDPVPHAHIVTSTTHKTLRGPRGGFVLCARDLADAVDRGCPLVLGGPLPNVMAAKAIAFEEASRPSFMEYARNVVENAAVLAEELQAEGIAVVTGGTDNHLVLLDVRPFGLTGRQAEAALRSSRITVNRNVVPYDTNGTWYTSGVRLGTAAVTTLGMRSVEMKELARLLATILRAIQAETTPSGARSLVRYRLDERVRNGAIERVSDLLSRYPAYPAIQL